MLVQHGIAVSNPTYNPNKAYDEVVKIIKPGRIISMDETRLTNDTMEAHKGKNNRSLLSKGDDGTTVVNKGGGDGTGIGGSTADGMTSQASLSSRTTSSTRVNKIVMWRGRCAPSAAG